jgi:phage terminase small subunit
MAVLKNAKHEAVAQSYFADPERIGWRAYQAHYPKSSQRASETAFSRLLKDAEFSARIAELDAAVAEAVVTRKIMDLEEVLQELSHLGRSNLKHCLVGGDNTADVVADLQDLPDDVAASIQEMTVEYYTEASDDAQEPQGHGGSLRRRRGREVKRVKIKLHDKKGALAELRRHYEPQKHADPNGDPVGTGAAKAAADAMAEKLTDLDLARRIAFTLEKAARAKPKAQKAEPKGKLKKRRSADAA